MLQRTKERRFSTSHSLLTRLKEARFAFLVHVYFFFQVASVLLSKLRTSSVKIFLTRIAFAGGGKALVGREEGRRNDAGFALGCLSKMADAM